MTASERRIAASKRKIAEAQAAFAAEQAARASSSRGPQGERGLSAYEIAVVNGFSGTVKQWLESLKGAAGTAGATGAAGEDGAAGVMPVLFSSDVGAFDNPNTQLDGLQHQLYKNETTGETWINKTGTNTGWV